MKNIISYFTENDDFQSVFVGLEEGLKEQLISGLSGSARTLFAASIYEKTNKPMLIVSHNLFHAQKIYEDLSNLLDENELFLFPVNDVLAAEISIASPELKAQRIEALNHLASNKRGVVITPIAGLKRILPSKEQWNSSIINFEVGKVIEIEHITNELVNLGYERLSMVATPGDFSVRGGIIDIYPLTEENPIRIELFDDEIDSIRFFSAEDQRSLNGLKNIGVGPAEEILFTQSEIQNGAAKLEIYVVLL